MNTDKEPSVLRVALFVWLGMVVCLAIDNFAFYFQAPILESSDAAVNGIMVHNAKHLSQLYGNYSRFQFNHPGPVFYYVYALGEVVFADILGATPSPGNAHLLTCMALQSAFFALAIAIAATWFRKRAWLPLVLLAGALHYGSSPAALVNSWPPYVLVMPALAFLVACTSVASGCTAHLPFAALCGGFLFHGHLAQSIFVGTLVPLAVALNLLHHRRRHGALALKLWFTDHRRTWIIVGVMAALFALPLVLDLVLLGGRSNIATILGRFRANTSDSKSLVQAIVYFLSFGTGAMNQDVITASGSAVHEFARQNVLSFLGWAAAVVCPALATVIWRRHFSEREKAFLFTGWLVLACAVGLCFVWGIAQAREMFHFNGAFYYSVYFFAVILGLAVLAKVLVRPFVPVVGAAVIAVAIVVLYRGRHVPPLEGPASGLPVQSAVTQGLAGDVATPRFLVFEHATWHVAASVALDLQRRAGGFHVAPWWGFMFGDRHKREQPAPAAEGRSSVWWITKPGEGGLPLTPELSLFTEPAPIRPGVDEIRLRGNDNGFRYVVSGVSYGNVDLAWTNLQHVTFRFATPPSQQDVRIVFDAKSAEGSASGPVPQTAVVSFNGVGVGEVQVRERAKVEVRVPASLWNATPVATLDLHFPQALRHVESTQPRYEEWGAWGLWSIRFDVVN